MIAGQIELKLGGMIKGMQENVLAKEFFGSVEVDRGQVVAAVMTRATDVRHIYLSPFIRLTSSHNPIYYLINR